MSVGKILRLRRLLSKGRALVVRLDQALPGAENPAVLVKTVAQSSADAVLLSPGILDQVAADLGQLAVILRVDGCAGSVNAGVLHTFTSVPHAAELGADAILAGATIGRETESGELLKLGRLAEEARRWGMPLAADMLPGGAQSAEDIALASRIGAQVGADIILTPYSGTVESYRRIVAGNGRPLLVTAGSSGDLTFRAVLSLVEQALSAGADGVVCGPQAWPQGQAASALAALAAVVHEDAPIEQALAVAEKRRSAVSS